MITEFLMGVVKWIVTTILGFLPDFAVPSWLSDQSGFVSTIVGYITGLSNWVPFGYAAVGAGVVLASMGVSIAIKLVRMVLSVSTGGGGSAG